MRNSQTEATAGRPAEFWPLVLPGVFALWPNHPAETLRDNNQAPASPYKAGAGPLSEDAQRKWER